MSDLTEKELALVDDMKKYVLFCKCVRLGYDPRDPKRTKRSVQYWQDTYEQLCKDNKIKEVTDMFELVL